METQILLKDPDVYPSDEVLQKALGAETYHILENFINTINETEYNLTYEWRYYNDGKAWLCKVLNKKKTILWLSIWEGFFKISFYFTEKHLEALASLSISEVIKKELAEAKTIGRLIPLIVDVNRENQIRDILTIVNFKKSLK